MKIDCYLSEHCGSFYELREHIATALKELGLAADVAFHTIYYDDAVSLGIGGSPTIRINGKDIVESNSSLGITWRAYHDESGRLRNVPSIALLKEAILRLGTEKK